MNICRCMFAQQTHTHIHTLCTHKTSDSKPLINKVIFTNGNLNDNALLIELHQTSPNLELLSTLSVFIRHDEFVSVRCRIDHSKVKINVKLNKDISMQ